MEQGCPYCLRGPCQQQRLTPLHHTAMSCNACVITGDPPPPVSLFPAAASHPLTVFRAVVQRVRDHRQAPGGQLVDRTDGHVSMHSQRQRAGDRCGRHGKHVRRGVALRLQAGALGHPKPASDVGSVTCHARPSRRSWGDASTGSVLSAGGTAAPCLVTRQASAMPCLEAVLCKSQGLCSLQGKLPLPNTLQGGAHKSLSRWRGHLQRRASPAVACRLLLSDSRSRSSSCSYSFPSMHGCRKAFPCSAKDDAGCYRGEQALCALQGMCSIWSWCPAARLCCRDTSMP